MVVSHCDVEILNNAGEVIGYVQTDEKGQYSIANLKQGTYKIRAMKKRNKTFYNNTPILFDFDTKKMKEILVEIKEKKHEVKIDF